MSVQNTNEKSSGFLRSAGGQTLTMLVVAAIAILLAWRYVF
jgi:hypothetical protein